jgi:hypothetical protein
MAQHGARVGGGATAGGHLHDHQKMLAVALHPADLEVLAFKIDVSGMAVPGEDDDRFVHKLRVTAMGHHSLPTVWRAAVTASQSARLSQLLTSSLLNGQLNRSGFAGGHFV